MVTRILEENARRRAKATAPYDPETGFDSPGTRFTLSCPELDPPLQHIPEAMRELPEVCRLIAGETLTGVFGGNLEQARQRWFRLRCAYDFPYWAFKTMKVKQKGGGGLEIPFLLNAPQRKLVGVFESMREQGLPIRVILVKARQWGGSTATQLYMLWIQLMRRQGFNSLIVGHQAASTEEVIGMAKRALDAYPRSLLAEEGEEMPAREKVYVSGGMSRSAIAIPRRNFRIKAGSAERPDSSRGGDYALVHLTEVGIWKKTQGKGPEDIIRAATSGVLLQPETMIVLESTANGVGNYFHKEYDAACRGASIYRPVFVAWFEIEQYADKVDDLRAMAERIYNERENTFSDNDRVAPGEYIWSLWEAGASLEAIAWYEKTRRGYNDMDHLKSEYPSTDVEAFVNSGAHVFRRTAALALKQGCIPPVMTGELLADGDYGEAAVTGIVFEEGPKGGLKVWEMPEVDAEGFAAEVSDRYLVVVDVGGRSLKADWSVIAVFDRLRMADGGVPHVVAQWRGHCDMDILAWLAARIATWYGQALLVIESNTLETRDQDRYVDGDQSSFILNQLRMVYRNLYARRQSPEDIVQGKPRKFGFHTNISTKPMIISNLVRIVREGLYVEREEACIDEYLTYCRRENGSYGAVSGKHDDILMTRAIGLHICYNEMCTPTRSDERRRALSQLRAAIQMSIF